MSEIAKLLLALNLTNDEDVVVATVVKVEGSAYRRPGARMLIPRLGSSVGTVSGGCLEGDLTKKAWWLTEGGDPVIRAYSTGIADGDSGEEEELAFGLGCNGTVHILLERVHANQEYLPAILLRQIEQHRRAAVLATVIGSSVLSVRIGERIALGPDGYLHTQLRHEKLAEHLVPDLSRVRKMEVSATQRYELPNGAVEVLFEFLPAPRRLVIFGAGHDALPLVAMAKHQDWHVTVIDSRKHFARRDRFPEADEVLNLDLAQVYDLDEMLNGAAVVVMSHSLTQDSHWLELALRYAPSYIGQLGPRSRTERLLDEMGAWSRELPSFRQLHYPMGLDIGGDSPASVALSVLAEITASFNTRDGAMLKNRIAPIHDCVIELHP